VGAHQKVSAVDCHTYGLLEEDDAFLEHRIPQLLHPPAGQWDAGARAPQEVQPKEIEPAHVCPPLVQGCNALTTVEWLLDATLRVLRDGQGLLLGNVLEGFVAHDDIDVILNFGQVLLVGTLNGNGNRKLDPLLLGAGRAR